MKYKDIETAYAEGLKDGWEQAMREFDTPKFPVAERWENAECPQCGRFLDDYEPIERCPWCGQRLKWE